MDKQPRVETVEEFKLRLAAIIRGKPEHPWCTATEPVIDPAQEASEIQKGATSVGGGFMHVYEGLLAIVQVPSYIPGGPWSFWKSIGLLLSLVGFAIALCLLWLALRWVAKKLATTFRKR